MGERRGAANATARLRRVLTRAPKGNRVGVCVDGGPFPVAAGVIQRRVLKMLAARALDGVEVSVALVTDPAIQQLNRTYRRKNKPTDVLAFAMEEGAQVGAPAPEAGRVLGDVIVSIDTAARQAAERGRPLLDEVTMLLAHGLLHLLGFDHRTDAEEREMTAATEELTRAAAARATRKT